MTKSAGNHPAEIFGYGDFNNTIVFSEVSLPKVGHIWNITIGRRQSE
jgi:hypothetical protein